MQLDELHQFGNGLTVATEADDRIDTVFDCGEAKLVQTGAQRDGEGGVGKVGQHVAPPQVQRRLEVGSGAGRVPRRSSRVRGGDSLGELLDVESTGTDVRDVAPPGGAQHATKVDRIPRSQSATQLRHVLVQRLGRGPRRTTIPDVLDELVAGHHPAGVDQEPGQHGALAVATQAQRPTPVHHGQRPENLKLHHRYETPATHRDTTGKSIRFAFDEATLWSGGFAFVRRFVGRSTNSVTKAVHRRRRATPPDEVDSLAARDMR